MLLKGDPGIGKTILCKKITWDWATKSFTKFSLVFLVLLKFVKSDESIEGIILQQNPSLKDMKVTLSKLQSILETFGSSCLVIFDGLDEHDFGTKTDVVSVMKGEKYLNCNILVTSRPHAVAKIEKNFPLVVRVGGFTRVKARQFVSKVIPNKQKTESIMNFNPVNLKGNSLIYECPTLLSFLCLLVKEDDIDLKDRTIHTGEIYMRMIRCLYKRFLTRKDVQFELVSFIKVLVSMGKLALKALLSGNSLLKKSEVLQGIGSDAFECGLLIGHEDADSPKRDDSVDIFVKFADRSLQQILAAFYFIWMLNQKRSIISLLGDAGGRPLFMTDPLFLKFCLWFLRGKQKYTTFRNSSIIYTNLKIFCVRSIKSLQLDLPEISETYPALDVTAASASKDELHIKLIADIFKNFNKRRCSIM